MKKRFILFFIVMIVLLAVPVGFSFASEECNHTYTDDNDCSTPTYCTICNKIVLEEKEHNYTKSLSYTFNKDENGKENFLLGGTRVVQCSNTGCNSQITEDVQPFINSLGYSIKEYTTTSDDGLQESTNNASIISTYFFNITAIEDYAKLYKENITYNIILYSQDRLTTIYCPKCNFAYNGKYTQVDDNGQISIIDSSWNDLPDTYTCPHCNEPKSSFKKEFAEPISKQGRLHENALLPNEVAGKITDIAIKNIPYANYDDNIVITAFIIVGNNIYYVQSDKLISDHNEIVPVTCNKILEKLNQK